MSSDAAERRYRSFGAWLRAGRRAAGLSQFDLARQLGVRQQSIARWEADGAIPQRRFYEVLATFLGVDFEELALELRREKAGGRSVPYLRAVGPADDGAGGAFEPRQHLEDDERPDPRQRFRDALIERVSWDPRLDQALIAWVASELGIVD